MNRRDFLKTGLLWLPTAGIAAPSLSFFGKSKGATSNGLLAPTVAYWKLDGSTTGSGFVWIDSTGHGWGATQHGALTSAAGLINGCAQQSSSGGGVVSASIDTRAGTTPFTVSLWLQDAGNTFAANPFANDDVTNRNWSLYMSDSSGGSGGANFVSLQTWLTTTGTYSGSITAASACHTPVQNTFDHILAGFDGSSRFIIINAGTKVTSAVATVARGTAAQTFMLRGDFLAAFAGRVDEIAYFNADMSAKASLLFNGGAGLPFSSYS